MSFEVYIMFSSAEGQWVSFPTSNSHIQELFLKKGYREPVYNLWVNVFKWKGKVFQNRSGDYYSLATLNEIAEAFEKSQPSLDQVDAYLALNQYPLDEIKTFRFYPSLQDYFKEQQTIDPHLHEVEGIVIEKRR